MLPRFSSYLLLAASAVSPLFADCVDGSRPATPAEQQFYTEITAAMKASLPPAPSGWVLNDRNQVLLPPSSFCKGTDGPMRLGYSVSYFWKDGEKELQKIRDEVQAKVIAVRNLPPDKQKEMDDLNRQARDLDRQAQTATKEQRIADAANLKAQSRELSLKARAIKDAHMEAAGPKITALVEEGLKAETFRTEVRGQVSVNQPGYDVDSAATRTTASPLTYSGPEAAHVFFGPWKAAPKAQGKWLSVTAPLNHAGHTKVQSVAIELKGTPHEAQTIAALFTAENAGALLGK